MERFDTTGELHGMFRERSIYMSAILTTTIAAKIVAKEVAKEAAKEIVKEKTKEELQKKLKQAVKKRAENVAKSKTREEIDENVCDIEVLDGVATVVSVADSASGGQLLDKLKTVIKQDGNMIPNDGKTKIDSNISTDNVNMDNSKPENIIEGKTPIEIPKESDIIIEKKESLLDKLESTIRNNQENSPQKEVDSASEKTTFEKMDSFRRTDSPSMEADEKFKSKEANNNEVDKEVDEVSQVVQNKRDGCERENKVEEELKEKYPESEGYQIVKEAYLRDEDGNFVVDPETGERRRIDFVVVKDGKVVDSVEVTSLNAPKDEQMAKEQRIRENGGSYIRDNDGNLVEFPADVTTRIESLLIKSQG